MPRIKLKQVDQINHTTVSYAFANFMRHCKLKNLSPYSYLYYDKNISFFLVENPEIKYVDEITWEKIENFISKLMDRGNRVTAINARLRALYVFLRYCFDQEYTSCTWNAINRQGQRMKFRDASGMHLLNIVDIIQGFQRFDNFGMGFIFFQHFAADGNGYGID